MYVFICLSGAKQAVRQARGRRVLRPEARPVIIIIIIIRRRRKQIILIILTIILAIILIILTIILLIIILILAGGAAGGRFGPLRSATPNLPTKIIPAKTA